MDAIGNTIQPIVSWPLPAPVAAVAPTSPKISASAVMIPATELGQMSFDPKLVEQKRLDTLTNAARNAPQPLGSQTFTMFKDASGQIVTRFRDANTGKVTYMPEPNLLRAGGSSAPVVRLKA